MNDWKGDLGMKRLTERDDSGNGFHLISHGRNPRYDAVDRLAAYENTGLEPEAVNALKLASMGEAIAEIKEFDGIPIDRLRELVEAEKDGRLVVLPCKVGDTVYMTLHGKEK